MLVWCGVQVPDLPLIVSFSVKLVIGASVVRPSPATQYTA